MKRPEYTLKRDIKIFLPGPMQDPLEFPAGTLIQPFWNEGYVPKHILEKLGRLEEKKPRPMYMLEVPGYVEKKTIVCLIGREWVEVEEDNIRSNY